MGGGRVDLLSELLPDPTTNNVCCAPSSSSSFYSFLLVWLGCVVAIAVCLLQSCDGGLLSTILSVGDTACSDDDSDGVCNADDSCPADGLNDGDSDDICDAIDSCPNDSRNDRSGPDGSPDGVCDLECAAQGGDLSLARNRVCNAENNVNACGWDGGDCAASTCET